MTTKEIITLVKQIKMLLPTISIPEFDGKSEEEQNSMLAIYIMQFGNLNYQITLRALNNITQNEDKMKDFRQAPIPTLARESVKLTQFTEEEKRKYKDEQEIIYSVDKIHCIMEACNKRTYKRIPEKDRSFTPLEEDYYKKGLMSRDEYWYWKDKENGIETDKPYKMSYNPKTRKNDLVEETMLKDFVPLG